MPKAIETADRLKGFDYAIRNIVSEAQKAEKNGKTIHYLNIGDPVLFGFKTPPHLIEAVAKAMRDGQNGYTPAGGILSARKAISIEYADRGVDISTDRIILTSGTSEGIELAITAIIDPSDEVLLPLPTYPFYSAVVNKLSAQAIYYQTDPSQNWEPDLDQIKKLISPRTRALVVINPNNPTGAVYSKETQIGLLNIADKYNLVLLADEVYADLAYDSPLPPLSSLNLESPVISFSSASKAYMAPGWRTGWMVVGNSARLNKVLKGIKNLADGRLCSNGPMQYAVEAALFGDRSYQETFRHQLKTRAELTTKRLNNIDGIKCVPPAAAFYAMPQVELPPGRTDQDFILGLLHDTGVLCVYGSGFGMLPTDGYFRIVYLAPPERLNTFFDTIEAFTAKFLQS